MIPANPKMPRLSRAPATSLPASPGRIHRLTPMHRPVILGFTGIEGGFPHSEILGSKLVRSSPRLIAAYHVLHRLSAPRHPPNALMTLDHSHGRCPPHKQQIIDRKTFLFSRNTLNPHAVTRSRRNASKKHACRTYPNTRASHRPSVPVRLGHDNLRIYSLFTMTKIDNAHEQAPRSQALLPQTHGKPFPA